MHRYRATAPELLDCRFGWQAVCSNIWGFGIVGASPHWGDSHALDGVLGYVATLLVPQVGPFFFCFPGAEN